MTASNRHNRLNRRMTGAVVTLAGTMLSYLLYAMSENPDSLFQPRLLICMLTAAVISFSIFSSCLRFQPNAAIAFLIGTPTSYLSFGVLILFTAATEGQKEFAEAIMWMPIWIAFGIAFMAPIVGSSFAGSILVFGRESREGNSSCTH